MFIGRQRKNFPPSAHHFVFDDQRQPRNQAAQTSVLCEARAPAQHIIAGEHIIMFLLSRCEVLQEAAELCRSIRGKCLSSTFAAVIRIPLFIRPMHRNIEHADNLRVRQLTSSYASKVRPSRRNTALVYRLVSRQLLIKKIHDHIYLAPRIARRLQVNPEKPHSEATQSHWREIALPHYHRLE